MKNKTLDDWLASSSDDEDGDYLGTVRRSTAEQTMMGSTLPGASSANASPTKTSSPVVDASPDRAGNPTVASPVSATRNRQEELREKMKKYLGEAAVSATVEMASPVSAAAPSMTVTAHSTNSSNSTDHGRSAEAHSSGAGGAGGGVLSPPPGYEAVEVMLVDRGTQTVSTVAVQTDPLPMPPISFGANRSAVGLTADASLFGNAPGVDYLSDKATRAVCGIDGRPYRHLMDDLEVSYAAGANHLRAQLTSLQHNIDMLISRYNLPPPPHY